MKYKYSPGDVIGDSFLKYVCEAGVKGSNRYVVTFCELCGTFSTKRLQDIVSGKIKSCGCYYDELVEKGKLHLYSVNARKNNPFLQRGGRRYREGLYIYIRCDVIEKVNIESVVRAIVEFVKNYEFEDCPQRRAK